MNYIGLDLATVSGIALYNPNNPEATVLEKKGDPVYLWNFLWGFTDGFRYMGDPYTVVIEEIHDFRNAKTTRSLLERTGYIKYQFISLGVEVIMAGPSEVRSFFNVKGKQALFDYMREHVHESTPYFTSNHSDALALAIYGAKGSCLDVPEIRVYK